jgi:hypothetical protein
VNLCTQRDPRGGKIPEIISLKEFNHKKEAIGLGKNDMFSKVQRGYQIDRASIATSSFA